VARSIRYLVPPDVLDLERVAAEDRVAAQDVVRPERPRADPVETEARDGELAVRDDAPFVRRREHAEAGDLVGPRVPAHGEVGQP